MSITRDQVFQVLQTVIDPELGRDLVTLGMVKDVTVSDGHVRVQVELTTPACPLRGTIRQDVERAVRSLGPQVQQVSVEFSARPQLSPQAQAAANNPLPQVRRIIAVGSGKGGVGKSTIAVNLAVGLARTGARVGILDGDVYGPSLPRLLGIPPGPPQLVGVMMQPYQLHGLRAMSLGALVDPEKPLIWRGPMAHAAFRQLAVQTDWGPLDYLVIDLPPGTGDVPLTMAQILPLSGAVIVCTPQKLAQDDVRRAVGMFQELEVPVLGLVENMSYFVADDGREYDVFGRGGAEALARELGLPFLGAVPISLSLRINSDAGNPTANFTADPPLASCLESLVKALIEQLARVGLRLQTLTSTAG